MERGGSKGLSLGGIILQTMLHKLNTNRFHKHIGIFGQRHRKYQMFFKTQAALNVTHLFACFFLPNSTHVFPE